MVSVRKASMEIVVMNEFRVVWEPRVFESDYDFPDELPEVKGLPWDRSDYDWQPASGFLRQKNDPILGPQMVLLRESGGAVGNGGVVEGLE
jgi:hypothetical protein